MSIINTTDASFDQDVLQADKPVLVDFWAAWCGPCKAIAPVLEDLDAEYGDKFQIVKVNVDDNPETSARFGIRSIPTLFVFKNGEKVDTVVVVKVNVDDNPETSARFGIRSIPTLFVFKNGEKVDTVVGSRPKSEFVELLNKHL